MCCFSGCEQRVWIYSPNIVRDSPSPRQCSNLFKQQFLGTNLRNKGLKFGQVRIILEFGQGEGASGGVDKGDAKPRRLIRRVLLMEC